MRENARRRANVRWTKDRARRDAEAPGRERELAIIEAENLPRREGDAVGVLQWTNLATGQVRRWTLRMGDRADRFTVETADGRATRSHGLTWIFDKLRMNILKKTLMMKPTLSILTPAIWSRAESARGLANRLSDQASALPGFHHEHLVLFDNRSMSIGEKRQKLLESARGEYVAFCDDDDGVSDDYLKCLAEGMATGADVVTFVQCAVIDGVVGHVEFRVQHAGDESWRPGKTARRRPWHVCAWKRELVADCRFLFCNYGEDAAWVTQACQRVTRGAHIPRILHTYTHSAETTAAPMPV